MTPDPAQALAACNAAGGSTGCDAPATPVGGTVAGPSILAELLHEVTPVQSVACGASAHQPRSRPMIRKSDQMEIFRAYDGGEAEWLAVRAKEPCEQARLILLAAAVIVALLSMPMAAQADWQYTKWGMSAEQALRASAGQLRLPGFEERRSHVINDRQPELIGRHATSSFRFSAALYFGATPRAGLDFVVLMSEDRSRRQTNAIIESLRGLYGEPSEARISQLTKTYRWRDDRANNSIEVYDYWFADNQGLQINYKPLRSGAEKGL
jgi:hypothetical protein